MNERPRDTSWWRRREAQHRLQWQAFIDRPEVRRVVERATDLDKCVDHLTALAGGLAPELAAFYGDELHEAVRRFVVGQVVQLTQGMLAAQALAERLPPLHMHRLPGTSLDLSKPIPPGTGARELLTLEEASRSYRPQGQPGRPQGSGTVRPDMARKYAEARALHQQGLSNATIAKRVLGVSRQDFDPDVARKVRRYIQRGRELERKSDTKS